MRFNGARFGGLLTASLLTAGLMTLLITLLSLPVSPLWPVLLGVLAAATVCLMDGTRLSWLPDAAWMAGCLLTVLALLKSVTNGLAQLLDAAVQTWQQLHARNYTSFLAQEDGNTGLTVVLCLLGVVCGLWSIRYVRQPNGLRFWPMALVLAAAAVLFAPLTAVWWLLLAALTLLLLYAVRFGGRHASSAPLRAWLRPAALLLACVTALGCWNGDAAHPAAVDTAARWTAARADTLRYGSNAAAGLPEGDMTGIGPRRTTEDTMLEITMTQPTSYYLRGFVGETYANSRWTVLDSKTLSEDADTFYWLHQDGFYAQSQLTTAAQAGVPDALRYDNTVTVQNVGASGKYLYVPYELLTDSNVLDAAQIGDRTLLASGLRGQRSYSFHASDNIITQYQRLTAALAEETEQTDAFLNTEAAYNRFVYDHYTDIPDDIRGFLEEKLGGYEKDEGQVHFDYRRAKQNILFYLTTYITYEENVLPITGGDFALTFLDGTQTGYDVHYATAAALMFRYYGIPARYVEGFLVTKDDAAHMTAGQTLPVDGSRAHAWVEYYQDGLGWLPFEVTPPYFSAMEKAERYQSISGLVGQASLEDTPEQPDDTDARGPRDGGTAGALAEAWHDRAAGAAGITGRGAGGGAAGPYPAGAAADTAAESVVFRRGRGGRHRHHLPLYDGCAPCPGHGGAELPAGGLCGLYGSGPAGGLPAGGPTVAGGPLPGPAHDGGAAPSGAAAEGGDLAAHLAQRGAKAASAPEIRGIPVRRGADETEYSGPAAGSAGAAARLRRAARAGGPVADGLPRDGGLSPDAGRPHGGLHRR